MGLTEMICSRLVGRRIVDVHNDEDDEFVGQVIQTAEAYQDDDGPLIRITTEAGEKVFIDPLSEIVVN